MVRACFLPPLSRILFDFAPAMTLFRNIQHEQRTYKHKIEARWRNRRCRGKSISITYSECVSVPLDFQDVMRMLNTVIYGLSAFTIFLHIIS
jgi:hypothetical protein